MTTLDGACATFTADDLLICDADDRPIGVGGVMGGLDTEITDATTTVALEIAWFEPIGVMQTAARLGLRSEASARFERGCRPVRDRPCDRPVRRTAARDLSRSRRARRAPSTSAASPCRRPSGRTDVRIAQVNRILGTALDGRRPRRAARPDRLHRVRRRRHAHASRCRRGDPTARPRSTSSRRSPATTATTASARRCRSRSCTARLSAPAAPPAAARGAARARHLRGDAEPVPRAGHSREGRPRQHGADDHQPARRRGERAAHVAAARAAVGDRVQRVAPSVRGSRCSRSVTSTRPARASCPTSTRRCASCSPVGRRPMRWRCGGRSSRRSASAPVSIRVACPPGLHPTRSATLSLGKDADRGGRRDRSDVLDAFDVVERVAVLELDLDQVLGQAAQAGAVEADQPVCRRATSTWRSSLPDDVPAEKLEQGDPPGRRRAARRPRPVRRVPGRRSRRRTPQPRLPAAAAGGRPQPHRRRHRRRARAVRRRGGEARRRTARLTCPIQASVTWRRCCGR